MKIEIDNETNAGYIYFKEIKEGEVKTTISLNEDIHVDLDEDGKIIGIEILNASKNIPSSALQEISSL